MLKTWMIADFLRPFVRWRINRADPFDDGRNARAAIGLIDAAVYVTQLDDSERVIVRMAVAGCFALGRFNPGAEGEALIRAWHYDEAESGPGDLLEALADAAERGLRSAAEERPENGARVMAGSGAGRRPSLPRPREGESAPA